MNADALRGDALMAEDARRPTVEDVAWATTTAVAILRALGGGRRHNDGGWFTQTGEEVWLCEEEADEWQEYVRVVAEAILDAMPPTVGRAR